MLLRKTTTQRNGGGAIASGGVSKGTQGAARGKLPPKRASIWGAAPGRRRAVVGARGGACGGAGEGHTTVKGRAGGEQIYAQTEQWGVGRAGNAGGRAENPRAQRGLRPGRPLADRFRGGSKSWHAAEPASAGGPPPAADGGRGAARGGASECVRGARAAGASPARRGRPSEQGDPSVPQPTNQGPLLEFGRAAASRRPHQASCSGLVLRYPDLHQISRSPSDLHISIRSPHQAVPSVRARLASTSSSYSGWGTPMASSSRCSRCTRWPIHSPSMIS
jgi:hypothetical protein